MNPARPAQGANLGAQRTVSSCVRSTRGRVSAAKASLGLGRQAGSGGSSERGSSAACTDGVTRRTRPLTIAVVAKLAVQHGASVTTQRLTQHQLRPLRVFYCRRRGRLTALSATMTHTHRDMDLTTRPGSEAPHHRVVSFCLISIVISLMFHGYRADILHWESPRSTPHPDQGPAALSDERRPRSGVPPRHSPRVRPHQDRLERPRAYHHLPRAAVRTPRQAGREWGFRGEPETAWAGIIGG